MTEVIVYPYGACECSFGAEGFCCKGKGPVAFEVTRDGRKLKVCTRCDLSSDHDKKLLVKEGDDAELFMAYDYLGAIKIASMLRGDS